MKVIWQKNNSHFYRFLLLCVFTALPQLTTGKHDHTTNGQCELKELCHCCRVADRYVSCQQNSLYIWTSFCMTWDNATDSLEISRCLYTQKHPRKVSCSVVYKVSTNITGAELNYETCKIYNREGPLCQQCIDGHGPAPFADGLYCADCSKHKHLWVLNLLFQLSMVTVVYLVVVLLQVRGTSSPYHIIITYCQVGINAVTIGSTIYTKVVCFTNKHLTTFGVALFGVLNLDFFRYVIQPLCISPSTKSINVLFFDYITALYPIILTIFIYVCIELHDRNCWILVRLSPLLKCLNRRKWNPKETVLNTCATLLLLSYSKFIFVSFNLLFAAPTYHCNGEIIPNKSRVLLFDPSIRFLHSEHIPYVVVACTVLVVFVLLPPLILLLYPTKLFRKCLRCCGFRRWDILQFTMDIFQGYYKDGTEGTFDYRAFSALYMIIRFGIALAYAAFVLSSYELEIQIGVGVLHILLGMITLIVRPYRVKWMSHTDGLVLMLIGILVLTLPLKNKILYLVYVIVGLSTIFFTTIVIVLKCLKKLFVSSA